MCESVSKLYGMFVVADELRIEYEKSAGYKVVEEYYQLNDEFCQPRIAAEHVVAYPVEQRGKSEPDGGEYGEFDEAELGFADVAVLEYEDRRKDVIDDDGGDEPDSRRDYKIGRAHV